MNELDRGLFEERLRSISEGMDYPRTPDIAGVVMMRLPRANRSRFISRRLAWSLTILLVLCASLMLIPPARAAIVEFIRIGIVRIFPGPVEIVHTPLPGRPGTATPAAGSSDLIPSLEQIAGRTSLRGAQQQVTFPILLPAYPNDLGEPDYVFTQQAEGTMVILVWTDAGKPGHALLSLHFIPKGSWAIDKMHPAVIEETSVEGQHAIWATGPYPLLMRNGEFQFIRLIEGHVLIWAAEDVTYRLETSLPLEEALKIAESLEPIPDP